MNSENKKTARQLQDVRQSTNVPIRRTEKLMQERITQLEEWLGEIYPNCDNEQAHLDEGTKERAYWHYGYLVALRDALALVSGNAKTLH